MNYVSSMNQPANAANASPHDGCVSHHPVALKLERVRRTFGSIVAVDDLSLEVAVGEIFGLLGPNGAGKSTTVNLAVGLLSPDEGLVTIGGHGRPTDEAVRARLGVAPQSLSLYEELTAEENLRFFGKLQNLTGAELTERVDWCLQFTGLGDRRRDRVKTYSGGMKRRLNLGVALVHDPQVLFLDEPTVGVDPQSRNAILEKVTALRSEGRTVIYTTHYMEEAQRLCDRVGIIDRGKLLTADRVEGLIQRHGGRSVVWAERVDGEVRIDTDDPLAELNRLQGDGKLLRFRVERPDLESVFLSLTGKHLRD